ncbi:MAG TPA: ATP-dependent DNA helicase RecG [bacterium]|nr:ATP-dependent DNA helicase RecG [bacterium]
MKISALPGVGPTLANKLAKLGIIKINQAINYYPFRYDDFSQQAKIEQLKLGDVVNFTGVVDIIDTKRSPRKRMYLTEAIINDGTGQLRLVWFNQPFLAKTIRAGDQLSVAGRVSQDALGLVITSPQYEKIYSDSAKTQHTSGLVPIYRTTSGITIKQLRAIIDQSLKSSVIKDWLPSEIIEAKKLWPLSLAIKTIHRPESLTDVSRARQRLAFDELLLLQLRGKLTRQAWAKEKAVKIDFKEDLTKQILAELPFKLTNDQKRAAWQVLQDMQKDYPMLRLLQGDVGSGKTAVAFIAAINVAAAGSQTAMLAPSEVLASQHFNSFFKAVGKYCTIGLLTRTQQYYSEKSGEITKISKAKLIAKINSGECQVVIGTQALLQDSISFNKLGLVIVDEQHRFGVEQRQLLLDKKELSTSQRLVPHFLSMTATPIPRSLALTLYGELNLSLIKEMPEGRLPVITKVVADEQRPAMYEFARQKIKQGEQVFIVCPLVEESEKLVAKSAKKEYERIIDQELSGYRVGLLHGKMSGADKQKIMDQFSQGKLDVLVATAVIELGVDIPGASIMIIESAERFGLAQLHQYRGRVGRRGQQAYCFLLSSQDNPSDNRRLTAMVKTYSGQELAQLDLAWRGPGELAGYEQSGFGELKLATIFDQELIILAKEVAEEIMNKDKWQTEVFASQIWQEVSNGLLPQ